MGLLQPRALVHRGAEAHTHLMVRQATARSWKEALLVSLHVWMEHHRAACIPSRETARAPVLRSLGISWHLLYTLRCISSRVKVKYLPQRGQHIRTYCGEALWQRGQQNYFFYYDKRTATACSDKTYDPSAHCATAMAQAAPMREEECFSRDFSSAGFISVTQQEKESL